jgi:hypothetical protein
MKRKTENNKDDDPPCLAAAMAKLFQQRQEPLSSNNSSQSPSTEADKLAVNELNELTLIERNKVYEEVHGVAAVQEETPAFLEERLEQLELLINRIRKKTAYDTALFLCPAQIRNRDFRLMFLRADDWDVIKASQKIAQYFEHKLQLFGVCKLCKRITLEDLNEDDLEALQTGSLQYLPQKDQAGRPVLFTTQRHHNYKTPENQVCSLMVAGYAFCGAFSLFWFTDTLFLNYITQLRAMWYIAMSGFVGDIEAQRKGLVMIFYHVGSCKPIFNLTPPSYLARCSTIFSKAMPLKFSAIHYCCDKNSLGGQIMNRVQMAIGTPGRLRFRVHRGTLRKQAIVE